MRPTRVMVWLIAAGVVAGCHAHDAGRPPTVRFGEEACDSCRMIISDDRFAAALVTPAGDALKFDDVGCLVKHEGDRLRPDVTYWVRDSRGGGWLRAREATYDHSPSVASPMGFGLAARPAGRPADGPGARSLRFDELPGFLADPAPEARADRPEAEAARRPASPS